jgi:hypothetical protein
MDFFNNNWLAASSNSNAYERGIYFSDPGVSLIFGGLGKLEFGEWANFVFTPILNGRIPISITSRQQNLAASFGAAVQGSWSSPELPAGLGTLFFQYTPSVRGNAYTQVGATMPCTAGGQKRSTLPSSSGIDNEAYIFARQEQLLPNGECVLVGRQGLASLSNSINFGWNSAEEGTHNISISLGHAMSFLRPIAKDDRSQRYNFSNFTQTVSGGLSYTFTIPGAWVNDQQIFLTLGTSNSVPMFTNTDKSLDAEQVLSFPFWDFYAPANNNSSVFFDISVTL